MPEPGFIGTGASIFLGLLAAIGFSGAIAIFVPRGRKSLIRAFAQFGLSTLTAEMAPLLILVLLVLTLVCIQLGALSSILGQSALGLIILVWIMLLYSISLSFRAKKLLEKALTDALGPNYAQDIPAQRQALLKRRLHLSDWFNPLGFRKPRMDVIRDVQYGPHGIKNQLDIYRPLNVPADGCPVLLQIHGGAWMFGQKGQQGLALMYQMVRNGWICVDINYRLSPNVGMPVHIQDCKSALCWIRENGAKYGMDTGFVATTGGSAGGHLCSLLGVTPNLAALQPGNEDVDTSVQACVPFYGPQDITYRFDQGLDKEMLHEWLAGRVVHHSPDQRPELWELCSPMSHIGPNAPPYLVIHGSSDGVVPVTDSACFVRELRKVSGSPVAFAKLPGSDHAFDLLNSIRSRYAVLAAQRFLEWTRTGRSQAVKSLASHPRCRDLSTRSTTR